MSDRNRIVHPDVDKSELRGRILGNLTQMRTSIDRAEKNPYALFKDIGVTPEALNDPHQRASLISKMTTMRNTLALVWHPDKSSNKEDQDRLRKLQEAYTNLKEKKQHALEHSAQDNAKSHFCAITNPESSPLVYQIQNGFDVDDVIQEFKDFYEQQTGKTFDRDTAAKEGYAYSVENNASSNILTLSCPDVSSRNACIQRLLDKNMIASPWQSLQPNPQEAAEASSQKDGQEDRSWLPRLEPAWAKEQ